MEEEQLHEQPQPPKKVTPLQLREQYHLNIAALAHQAKVGPSTVYFMMVGKPISRQHAEQILATISTLVGQTYTLENVQVALSEEQQGDEADVSTIGETEEMNIAVLAWGSLVLEPRELALASVWELCGPEIPLEFSRVSTSRCGALTLVIDPIRGVALPTYVALSAFQTLNEAIESLGEREGGGPGCVGYVNCQSGAWYSRQPPSLVSRIADWGKEYGFGAAIWTDLEPNFETINKTRFSDIDERATIFTVEHAKRYLHGLRPPGDALARAYINNAPPHIQTPLRQSLMSDPWLVISSGEEGQSPEAGTTNHLSEQETAEHEGGSSHDG